MDWSTPTTYTAEDVRDLMVATVAYRLGPGSRLAELMEWRTDDGSPYIAGDKRCFAREIGPVPRTTPVSSPHRHQAAASLMTHYKEVHSPPALEYRYIVQTREARSGI